MGGVFPTTMSGYAAFEKVDFTLSPKELVFIRLNTSRYNGINNVFFDPSSPMTVYAESANGIGERANREPGCLVDQCLDQQPRQ